ncbi:FAD-binding domain-containing protein [Roridomyces roridus]|uniref:FAD-binding domain-containing protein n=1 Tax=Roridomyces roridus TaxID=1738132 RepID=A0AAD7FC41_9AGAR|nr:FAD-binding domain-containing protein [Roridomyces roridus]
MLFLYSLIPLFTVGVAAQNASTTAAATAAQAACLATRLDLGPTKVKASGTQYDDTTEAYWSFFNRGDEPTCIVYPSSASDVQVAMGHIFHSQSDYAVRAGGHSPMIGWNGINNGVLISFEDMTAVSYDATSDTITVQPGATAGSAEAAVESHGVSPVWGRADVIGTGLLLGGGIAFQGPLYGWASDRIKELDVVLVTGQLVTATATNQYSDLFLALRGGANRFGIVTRYELYAAHTGTRNDKLWYGGLIVYPGSAATALLKATAHYVRDLTDPNAGAIMILNAYDTTSTTAHACYFFYKGTSLPTSIFGEFLSIPSTSQTFSSYSYYDITFLIQGDNGPNGQQFGASSFIGDETTFINGYAKAVNFTQHFADQLIRSEYTISPIPQSVWAASLSGPNAIGNPGVNYATVDFNLVFPDNEATRPPLLNAAYKLLLAQNPPSPGLPLYINECHQSQEVLASYGNYAALQATYAKYDPTGFNVAHTRGPKGL